MSERSVYSTGWARYVQYPVLTILVISSLAFAAGGYVTKHLKSRANDIPPVNLDAQPTVVVITLKPTGFEPRELTLPAGRALFVVENRSGLTEMGLELLRQTPVGLLPTMLSERAEDLNALKKTRVQIPREKPTWGNVVELAQGQYVLHEINHDDFTCQITVTER